MTLLDHVHNALRDEYVVRGKQETFDVLHDFMDGASVSMSLDDAAISLCITKGAAKVVVCRMRERRRQILRAQIAETVGSPELIDEEIGYLISLFESGNSYTP